MDNSNDTPFKIIVKKLPTNLKQEEFLKTIEKHLSDLQYSYYIAGKSKFFTQNSPNFPNLPLKNKKNQNKDLFYSLSSL